MDWNAAFANLRASEKRKQEERAQRGGDTYSPAIAPKIPVTHTGGTDDVCQVCQMEFDLNDNHFGACFGHNPEKFESGDSGEQRLYKIRGNAGTFVPLRDFW